MTRDLVRAQLAPPRRSRCGGPALGPGVLLEHIGALERHQQLAAAGVLELDALVGGAVDGDRPEAEEAAEAVLGVDHDVTDLEVAQLRQDIGEPAPGARRRRQRGDVAAAEHREARLAPGEAVRQIADHDADFATARPPLTDGELRFAEQVQRGAAPRPASRRPLSS